MTKLVTIHCNPNGLDAIKELNLNWEYSPKYGKDEIDVIVPDVDYNEDSYIVDPDDQLCDYYDINPDIVHCIEARNFVAQLLSKAYNLVQVQI